MRKGRSYLRYFSQRADTASGSEGPYIFIFSPSHFLLIFDHSLLNESRSYLTNLVMPAIPGLDLREGVNLNQPLGVVGDKHRSAPVRQAS